MPGERDRRVGRTLRRVREERGITQLDLAMRLGLPQSLVGDIEAGVRPLKLSEVFWYSYALGLDARRLVRVVGREFPS